MKKLIWNINFSEFDQDILFDELYQHCKTGKKSKSIAFVNPHTQVEARKNSELLDMLNGFDYVICDGVGTQLASRLYPEYRVNRLSGPAFFRIFCERNITTTVPMSFFFLGSTDAVLAKIRINMKEKYPHIVVAGTYSPPMGVFTEHDNEKMVQAINQSKCTVLWVGLTAPKQEEWIAEHLSSITVPIAAGIGAEFDYFAGVKKRPAKWISDFGLQWLHRLLTQSGVWQRTLVSAPIFIFHVLLHRIKLPARIELGGKK